jgi:hypothetical protein
VQTLHGLFSTARSMCACTTLSATWEVVHSWRGLYEHVFVDDEDTECVAAVFGGGVVREKLRRGRARMEMLATCLARVDDDGQFAYRLLRHEVEDVERRLFVYFGKFGYTAGPPYTMEDVLTAREGVPSAVQAIVHGYAKCYLLFRGLLPLSLLAVCKLCVCVCV